jgi:hypothetical protein
MFRWHLHRSGSLWWRRNEQYSVFRGTFKFCFSSYFLSWKIIACWDGILVPQFNRRLKPLVPCYSILYIFIFSKKPRVFTKFFLILYYDINTKSGYQKKMPTGNKAKTTISTNMPTATKNIDITFLEKKGKEQISYENTIIFKCRIIKC